MTDRQAAHIPDLRSLLSARGRGARRGRGRGAGGPNDVPERFEPEADSPQVKDAIVQRTDQDAASSRMSAVELGYLDDPFSRFFMTGPTPRRFPIMNRGTYVRTTAIDRLVETFLQTDADQPKQIISLGAGTDTRYFRLLAKGMPSKLLYHELDFAHNTGRKIATIQRTTELMSLLRGTLDQPHDIVVSFDATALTSPWYNIHPVDLRSLKLNAPLAIPNVSGAMPTLLLSECCLIYLTPSAAAEALQTITQKLIPSPTPVSIVIYEPIRPNDSFGRTMVANLATRGIVLETLQQHPNLTAQRQRFRDAGFGGGQRVADTEFLWRQWVSEAEKERVSRVEMLDEVEEWILLAKHYCVAWAWRESEGHPIFTTAWSMLPEQHGD